MLGSLKGRAALIIGIGTVVVLLIFLPAYRIFFAISLGIGIVVAAILYFWHKLRPVRAEEINDKRPFNLR